MRFALVLAIALAAPAAAQHSQHAHDAPFGKPADAKKATRTIRVDMTDNMRFTPAEIRVKRGEIVRFVLTNKGQVEHEFVLGTMAELKKHAAHMREQPQTAHEGPDEDHVPPGKSSDVAWQFTRAGEFYYGCLIPGHFEAGMVGRLIVE